MVTRLRGLLRREIRIGGVAWVVSISDEGLKLVEKGRRKGLELAWQDLVSGDAALAAALNASVRASPSPRRPARTTRAAGSRPPQPKTRRSSSAGSSAERA